MVTARKCHGYVSQVPWLRFASAMVTMANSHYNKKKGCLEWFVSRQPFVFYRIKAMLASCLWLALVFLVVSISLACGKH